MGKKADRYLVIDPWKIIENTFCPEKNQVSESIFTLSNEYMGVRGYFDEGSSLHGLRGSYCNGIYEQSDCIHQSSYKGIISNTHFMINAVDWLHTSISIDGEFLDLGTASIENYQRSLDLKSGLLVRSFDWLLSENRRARLTFERFLDMEKPEYAYQSIECTLLNFSASVSIVFGNDFSIRHQGKNKNFWKELNHAQFNDRYAILAEVKKNKQKMFSGFLLTANSEGSVSGNYGDKCVSCNYSKELAINKTVRLEKTVINYVEKNSRVSQALVWQRGLTLLNALESDSFQNAYSRQLLYWSKVWKKLDITIEGDQINQQGIRYCIFQMQQTYHGMDPSNNIGAKGLSGEAYNGHAFWDTETYCLPFYLFSNITAARNLLEYRYAGLPQARERARMLDCKGACYPVATLNGEEACDLWQHASLQFQPSTGIAYAIAHYVRISGDTDFLYGHGIEMLLEISRFLLSRGSWNQDKSGFGFYAVMGPDEFHMMVNNNCYTNILAKKTFEYTLLVLQEMQSSFPARYAELQDTFGLNELEKQNLSECAEKMIILYDKEKKLYEQHENYFHLPHLDIHSIPVDDFPLYHNWSYDRIYRSDMIKQPDVLMFMFLYNQEFSRDVKKANYLYYEPRTIHESSLSPSIHSVFASELGMYKEAFTFFAFATRMDLDNYNRNTDEGLHITSLAAAWINIVYGFGGLRSDSDLLCFNPSLPEQWKAYSFNVVYQGTTIHVSVRPDTVHFSVLESSDALKNGQSLSVQIYQRTVQLGLNGVSVPLQQSGGA